MPDRLVRRAGLVQLLNGRRTNAVRRFVAIATVLIGAAGLVSVPSDGVTRLGAILMGVVSASTVPIGLLWYRGPWSGRYDVAFLIYADLGILLVLLGYESMFVAMPGVALMSFTSLFAAMMTSQRVAVVHTVLTVAMLAIFVVGAAVQGSDGFLLASRTMTVASLLLVPIAIFVYTKGISRQLDRIQRDPGTGLWNRMGLESLWATNGRRPADAAALICLSVTASGFDGGRRSADGVSADALIREMVTAVKVHVVPAAGALARTATTELVYCKWETDVDAATSLAARWERTFDGHELSVAPDCTIRCGTAVVVPPSNTDEVRDDEWALQRALTAAELRRRGKVRQHWSPAAQASTDVAEEISCRVRAVIRAGGPQIVFQPIRDATTLDVVGLEALSRFPGSTRSPLDWFAEAWSVGLGPALEEAAASAALRHAASIREGVSMFLNTSAATLLTTDLAARLIDASSRRRIIVEITEHDAIDEYDAVLSVLRELRSSGIGVAVDDVGAGYAGLRQLIALAPEIVKLDAHVVRGIYEDPARRAAAEAITLFARRTGTRSLFEGIESQDDLVAARRLGVDLLQGYLLGEPCCLDSLNYGAATTRTGLPNHSPGGT